MKISFQKVWFVFSLMALSFVYGVGVGNWEWFPHSFIERAMDQAVALKKSYLGSSPPQARAPTHSIRSERSTGTDAKEGATWANADYLRLENLW